MNKPVHVGLITLMSLSALVLLASLFGALIPAMIAATTASLFLAGFLILTLNIMILSALAYRITIHVQALKR